MNDRPPKDLLEDRPNDPIALLAVGLGLAPASGLTTKGYRGLDSLVAYQAPSGSERGDISLDRARLRDATTWTLVDETLQNVSGCLAEANVPFVLLKGAAVSPLYPAPHLRPTSDLDILIAPDHFDRARAALEQSGWQPVVKGRFAERYLREEGSCWQAHLRGHTILELHFRFWGSVPDSFASAVLDQAERRADDLMVPTKVHCLIIAAAHCWRQAIPRRAVDLLDVCLLLQQENPKALESLRPESEASGQLLPVCLAVAEAAQALEQDWAQQLLAQLEAGLRRSEVRVLTRLRQKGQDNTSWARIRLAMLRAGRPSRAGWRSLRRQVWPHPGVLEQRTSGDRAWPIRRLIGLSQTFNRFLVRR